GRPAAAHHPPLRPDHPRRGEHLPDRGRERPRRVPGAAGVRRRRRPPPRPRAGGRGGRGLRRRPAPEEELIAFAKERLAYFKVPTRWRVTTDPLPRNATGKVLRKQVEEELS